jgi:hypothetical protein
MCEIGKPIEIINVAPLSLPAPLPRAKNEKEFERAANPAIPAKETALAEDV